MVSDPSVRLPVIAPSPKLTSPSDARAFLRPSTELLVPTASSALTGRPAPASVEMRPDSPGIWAEPPDSVLIAVARAGQVERRVRLRGTAAAEPDRARVRDGAGCAVCAAVGVGLRVLVGCTQCQHAAAWQLETVGQVEQLLAEQAGRQGVLVRDRRPARVYRRLALDGDEVVEVRAADLAGQEAPGRLGHGCG